MKAKALFVLTLVGLSLCWTATGCGGGQAAPPPPPMVSVTVSPSAVTVLSGAMQNFTATVTGTNDTAVMWSVQEAATGGSITSVGSYTAPQAAGTYHVVATSHADSSRSAMASVAVPPVAVAISPNAATVFSNGTQNFAATVTGTTNLAVTWSVQEGTAGGSITSAGIYRAPQAIGTYHVVATSQADSTKSAMASVNVPPVSVSIIPTTATMGPSGTFTFVVTVAGTLNTAVAWTVQEGAAGGSIDGSGNYTAPTTLGTYHVVASTVADPSKSSSATVRVVASGFFTSTGSMATARMGHTATPLPNGKVLVAGGGTAELYDPASEKFTATGNMVAVRFNHTATLLPNGKVLIAGGADGPGLAGGGLSTRQQILASTELFDPVTGSFTANAHMGTERALHTATLLASGQVLVVGGLNNKSFDTGDASASAEVYDPATGTFSAAGNIVNAVGSESHTATLLSTGKVLVGGGLAFVYGVLWSAQLFDPTSQTFLATGNLTTARTFYTATVLPDGRVVFIGGDDRFSVSLSTLDLFDPSSGSFTSAGGTGAPRSFHTATFLPSGEVLVAGGIESFGGDCVDACPDVTLGSAELFNPGNLNFTLTGGLGTARAHHTATLLQNGRVLIVGGSDDSGNVLASAELYH